MAHTGGVAAWARPAGSRAAGLGLAVCVLLGAGLLAPGTARAEDDPFGLLHEEQVVTAAAKHAQPLSETPSAVSVITAAEIRAMGYRTLGEALAWARDLYVSYDRNYTYVGVRGLLRPGDYNDRVLLTIDGHAINGPVFQDATFGPELGLDMSAVQRIEIVRGPGSALYGTSAVLAVINVVTRRPQDEPGLAVETSVGAAGDRRAALTASRVTPGGIAASVHASLSATDGTALYYPTFDTPETNFGRAVGVDGERAWSLFGTLEAHGYVLRAKFNDRLKHIPTASFDTRFNDPGTRTWDGHDFVELSTERRLGPALNLNSRVYWDGVRYHGDYMYGPDSARVVNFDQGDADQVGAEARVDWSPHPRHVITAGVERADVAHLVLYDADLAPYTPYVDVRDRFKDSRTATFAQIESRLGGAVRVTLGERFDVTNDGSAAWSPRADLVWHLGAATTLKALAGSAFRSPSEFERKYATSGGSTYLVNPDLAPERMRTYELGIDRRWSGLRAQASLYHDHVRGLIDLVPLDSTTLQYQNVSGVRTEGASVELEHADAGGRRVRLSCGVQRSRIDGSDAKLENSPACIAQLLGSQPVLARRGSLALGVRYGAPRKTLSGTWTAGAAVCDGRLSYRPRGALELGLECRNLFDARWSVPASPEHAMDTIEQDGRRLSVTAGIGARSAP